MYVCVYMYECVCMYVCNVHMRACRVCCNVCVYACMCMHVCGYVRMYVCMHVYMHVFNEYVCVYIHTPSQIQHNAHTSMYNVPRVTYVCGGISISPQIATLKNGVDVLMATPGRLLDLVQKGVLLLDRYMYVCMYWWLWFL